MNITRFALSRRTMTMTAVVLLVLAGIQTFVTMSRREDPAVTIRKVPVITVWPGAPASKVEALVTDPVEKAISQISEVEKITSKSRAGISEITVELEETIPESQVDQLWDEVRTKVAEVAPKLPEGCQAPNVNTGYTDVFSVCLALYQQPPGGGAIGKAQRYSYRQLEVFAELVEDELKAIPSVAKVKLVGTQQEQVQVVVDAADWSKLGITEAQLAAAVNAQNIVASGGEVDTGTVKYSLRPTGEFDAVDQLREVVVTRRDGVLPVYFKNLPFVTRRTHRDPRRKLVKYFDNQGLRERAVVLAVSMKDGRNVVDMGRAVDERVRYLLAEVLPADIQVTTVNDLPRQVDQLVTGFMENLIQAVSIVLLVAFLMMGWRPALIMATAVPLTVVASFVVFTLFDVELEQFSIASLIIALGMIVDNAIVVSDNCLRLLREGRPRFEAMVEGASGLAVPILTSTLTTVAAFLPMLTIPGTAGEYVRSLPIVVATTLLVSYAVAMTVTPIMCWWLLPKAGVGAGRSPMEFVLRLLGKAEKTEALVSASLYDKPVLWCLEHKWVPLSIAGLALVGALTLPLGSQFFPEGDRDQLFVTVWLPEGASVEATARVVDQVETRIRASDGAVYLQNAVAFVGTGGPRFFLTASPEKDLTNYAYLIVNTTDATISADWVRELQPLMEDIPGCEVSVERFKLGPGIRYPVEVLLSGPDDQVLRAKAEELMALLRETPGLLNANSDWASSSYEIVVDIDTDAANLAGVSNASVAETTDGLISGALLTSYREGDHQVPVVLQLTSAQRRSLADISGIYVNGETGKVPLSSIARVRPSWQPSVIARENQIRTVTVGAKVLPGFLSNEIAESMEPKIERIVADLPPGYRWRFEGELGETKKSQQDILGAFQISLLLILMVLITQYNSILKPLVVLAAVPLSLIGALLGLYLTGWSIGFMVMLGLVSLAGVVINNAIILIDFIETGVRAGVPLRQAVAEAGRLRMKPILLTSLTTIGGMLPLALFGGPMWAGMAWAVIFGLAVSTVLTLVVVPTLYTLVVERFGVKIEGAPVVE